MWEVIYFFVINLGRGWGGNNLARLEGRGGVTHMKTYPYLVIHDLLLKCGRHAWTVVVLSALNSHDHVRMVN